MPVSTTAEKLKPIRKRCAKAYEDSHDWRELTDELNDYTLTHRTGVNRHTGHARSKNRHAAHDATAGKARQRFAGRMSRDVTPPFQKFSEIKLGPASMAKLQEISQSEEQAKGQADELNKVLETVSNQVQGIFERAQFALAAEEMYLDLFAGQGAMLVLEDDDDIVQFVSVPATEIAMREDGRGRVNGIYWRKAITAGNLPGMWKDPQFSSELAKKIKDTPEQMIAIVQAGEFDAASKRWNLFVYEDEKSDDPPIFEELGTLTTAWITPRFYKVPGEAHGRGPGLTALPTIKTLDKVTELTIKAAAFAVLGLWVYRNDRAFNPQTSKMAPGAMWKVRDTSGPQGPSIQKLDVPGRFDVSNLILQDLREQVKQITFDDTLPPDAGAVRSATEIVERLNRLQQDLSGAFARMVLEIVVPLVKRVVDILQRKGLINLGDF
ncbi:MAG: portal protein, partial [Hyphomicrobiales bacterium]|nr:portal protein [Hyphomicrobiales bacterium]